MGRKMIFFDIDGTLMERGIIPESAVEAIRKTREKGNFAFINTGRAAAIVDEKIRNVGFDGMVSACGTSIYMNDELIVSHTIPRKICEDVVLKMREFRVAAFLEANSGMYFDEDSPFFNEGLENAKNSYLKSKIRSGNFWEDETITFDKIYCVFDETAKVEEMVQYLSPNFTCIPQGKTCMEIVPKPHSKATGIQFLQEYLNIPAEDCYVLGDSDNDIEMFEAVPNSIAMGVCSQKILEMCSYQTAKVLDDGVYKALEHYGLI